MAALNTKSRVTVHRPTPFGEILVQLEAAAEAQDESAFLVAYRTANWQSISAPDFTRAVRLALTAGAYGAARSLAIEGAALYPKYIELQKMAHILASPEVKGAANQATLGVKANRDWLKSNWDSYRNRWVALREGELLDVADSLDELVEKVGELKGTGILVTKVHA
jgi:hypothetical protein